MKTVIITFILQSLIVSVFYFTVFDGVKYGWVEFSTLFLVASLTIALLVNLFVKRLDSLINYVVFELVGFLFHILAYNVYKFYGIDYSVILVHSLIYCLFLDYVLSTLRTLSK